MIDRALCSQSNQRNTPCHRAGALGSVYDKVRLQNNSHHGKTMGASVLVSCNNGTCRHKQLRRKKNVASSNRARFLLKVSIQVFFGPFSKHSSSLALVGPSTLTSIFFCEACLSSTVKMIDPVSNGSH